VPTTVSDMASDARVIAGGGVRPADLVFDPTTAC
jgi:hypothetical protein